MNISRTHFRIIGSIMLLAWSAAALSAPSVSQISGKVAHGSQVTISGSGFGAKSPAKPVLWAPMDGNINPSPLGLVSSYGNLQNVAYNATEGASGGGVMKSTNNSGTYTARVDGYDYTAYGQKSYLYRKMRRNFSVNGINWKSLRLWPSGTNYPNFSMNPGFGLMATEWSNSTNRTEYTGSGGPVNQWYTEELLLQSNSSVSASDGIVRQFINGKQEANTTNWSFRNSSASSVMREYYVVHGVIANSDMPSGGAYWADDVYLDITWARVMIGNASSLAASTRREIQIPSAWSDSSITVTVNSSAFPSSETPYLFVIDASGNASAGFPVTNKAEPNPPFNVTVQ